jgi:hypothetical protein
MTPQGGIVARIEEPMTPPMLVEGDLRPLRHRVAGAMDRLLHDIQSARLDLDDCVVERRVELRVVGGESAEWVELTSLIDAGSLLKPFMDSHLSAGSDDNPSVEATRFSLAAVRAHDYPPVPQAASRNISR